MPQWWSQAVANVLVKFHVGASQTHCEVMEKVQLVPNVRQGINEIALNLGVAIRQAHFGIPRKSDAG
jgi:hypothetical protein